MTVLKDALIEILIGVIGVVVPILSNYLIKYLKSKTSAAQEQAKTEAEGRILYQVDEAVEDAVTYVSQTMVDSLKAKGEFDKDAQRQAFQTALSNTMNALSSDACKFLFGTYEDVTSVLTTKIEAAVKRSKQ